MPQVQRAPLQVGARRRRRRRWPSARPGEPSLLPCTMRILNIPGQFCLASCRKSESTTEPCTSTFQFPKPSLSACPRHRENQRELSVAIVGQERGDAVQGTEESKRAYERRRRRRRWRRRRRQESWRRWYELKKDGISRYPTPTQPVHFKSLRLSGIGRRDSDPGPGPGGPLDGPRRARPVRTATAGRVDGPSRRAGVCVSAPPAPRLTIK